MIIDIFKTCVKIKLKAIYVYKASLVGFGLAYI